MAIFASFARYIYLPNLHIHGHNCYIVLCSPLVALHWHRNGWPWMTFNCRFALKSGSSSTSNGLAFLAFGNKKAVLSQRWPRNAPYTWMPWKFLGLPDYAHGYYSQHFHGLLLRSTLWMFLQNLKSVDLSVPEIIGRTQKIRAVAGYAHAPFFTKFLTGFYSDWSCKCAR